MLLQQVHCPSNAIGHGNMPTVPFTGNLTDNTSRHYMSLRIAAQEISQRGNVKIFIGSGSKGLVMKS